jgi:hypothetical protein
MWVICAKGWIWWSFMCSDRGGTTWIEWHGKMKIVSLKKRWIYSCILGAYLLIGVVLWVHLHCYLDNTTVQCHTRGL